MKRIINYIILIPILTACLSPRYKVNEKENLKNTLTFKLDLGN
jgi:hypothetical protein